MSTREESLGQQQTVAEMERVAPTSEALLLSSTSSSSSSFSGTRFICHVCQKLFSQYTCPRCNTRYCSLQCYRRHNPRCTESFMRENLIEEMGQMQPDSKTKWRMLDIIKKFHLEEEMNHKEDDMDEDSILTEETIQKILTGIDVCLEDLSSDAMKKFQRSIASGELSKMIDPWEPWWLKLSARLISLSQDGTQLVRPIDGEGLETSQPESLEVGFLEIPPGPETPLPPPGKLTNRDASPLLAVHLVEVLYTYCFTLRLYNGDWHCDPLGAATVICSMSSVLSEGGRPETVAETLSNCLERTCSPIYRHIGGLQFGLGLLDDVISLFFLGMRALVCLLCDLQRLILAGERMLKSEKMGKGKRVETRTKLRHAERKVYFMMCWVHEQPGEAWSSLANIVQMEKTSFKSVDHQAYKLVNADAKREPKSKLLIEEVQHCTQRQ